MSVFRDPSVVINSKYKTSENRPVVFPMDLLNMAADRNFYISINFERYERRSIFDREFKRKKGGICLPMPSRIVDSQGVTWSATEQGGLIGGGVEQFLAGGSATDIAAAAAMGGIVQSASGVAGAMGGIIGAIVGGIATRRGVGADAGQALGTALGKATGAAADKILPAVLQVNGQARNPFMTVMFKQPEYKTHQFSWTLAPRNAQESDVIKRIVETLKSNMLPAFTPGSAGVLMTYPNIANISLYPSDKFLYKFKPCALTKFSVNYAGGGSQPSFFKGTKAPTIVEISTEWQEIEYWMKEDIESPNNKDWREAARNPSLSTLFKD